MILELKNISKSYGPLQVLKQIDLVIPEGKITAIVGPSGAGKSTLLQIMGSLDRPDSGEVRFNDQRIEGMNTSQLAKFRNEHIGFVFQFHHLLPEFTALENVCIPAYAGNRPVKETKTRAEQLLTGLGLQDRMHHKPSAMSGGEQQRVAVARALMNKPAIVMADEPSGNLDTANALALHDLFFRLRDEMGQTFVIVTHNPELAARADFLVKMKDGRVE
jgi:lipoprotein-releasing system ATP-binding protein